MYISIHVCRYPSFHPPIYLPILSCLIVSALSYLVFSYLVLFCLFSSSSYLIVLSHLVPSINIYIYIPYLILPYVIPYAISSHLISSYLILSYLSMESFYPDARSLSSRTVFCLSFAGCDTSCCTLGWFQILGPVATKGPRTRDLKVILVLICSILHDLYPFRISIYHPYIAYYTLECIYIHIYI